MPDRDENGLFKPGHTVKSPGRPSRVIEGDYLQRMTDLLTFEKWEKIVNKAIADAIKGNGYARQWLSDYVIGKPPQILELRGADAMLLSQVIKHIIASGRTASELFEIMLQELQSEDITHE